MDTTPSLEDRVATLERSLRRSRRASGALGLGALVLAAGAFTQQTARSLDAPLDATLDARLQTPPPQSQEQVATQRLTLTNELNAELVVLRGGTDGSLLVLTPDGREIVRLGGPAARRIGH